jgi:hypothetical protein
LLDDLFQVINKCQITRQTYKVKSALFFKNECAYIKSNKV